MARGRGRKTRQTAGRRRTPHTPQLNPNFNDSTIQETIDSVLQQDSVSEVESDAISVSSTNSSQAITTQRSAKSKPKLQIFRGLNDKVSIENWLKRFEMLGKYYNWSESDKIVVRKLSRRRRP